jgi:hypothetical protein
MAQRACFWYDMTGKWATVGSGGGGGGAYAIILKPEYQSLMLYILGILNSTVSTFYLKSMGSPFRGGYFGCDRHVLNTFPVRHIDLLETNSNQMQEQLIVFVQEMLDLQEQLQNYKPEELEDIHNLERQITLTDQKIDDFVCDLYELSNKDRKAIKMEHISD